MVASIAKTAALITVVLFAGLAFAAEVPHTSPYLGDWVPVVGLTVLVAYLISALAFMIGIGFKYDQVTEWAKNEFWEATLSAFMVAIIFFLVAFVGDISTILTGGDHFAAAYAYILEAQAELIIGAINGILLIAPYSILSSSSFNPNPFFFYIAPVPYFAVALIRFPTSYSLFGGYGQVISSLSPFFYTIWTSLLSLSAINVFLLFVEKNMFSFFLPFGFICRAFPITRRIGGTMIAMALTLYFVYPLSLALCKPILDIYVAEQPSTGGEIANIVLFNNLRVILGMLTGHNVHMIIDAMTPKLQLAIAVIVLNVLVLIITITSFRAIAIAVGGDPQIFGLGKLGV